MGTRSRPVDRAVRRIETDLYRVLADIGSARRNAGLSFDTIGAVCHVDGSTAARVVSGETFDPDLRLLAAIAATVGQELRLRVFPAGDPIRDIGQQRLLERFRPRVAKRLRWRTEVPLRLDGDLRAWDAVVSGDGWAVAVEAETVLDDLQALERRIALKQRDGGMAQVILVIANTRRNRRALAAAPAAFNGMRGRARGVLAALGRVSIRATALSCCSDGAVATRSARQTALGQPTACQATRSTRPLSADGRSTESSRGITRRRGSFDAANASAA